MKTIISAPKKNKFIQKYLLLLLFVIPLYTHAQDTCSAAFSFSASAEGHAQFTPKVDNNSFHYFWDFGDGQTSNLKNPDHSYTTTGLYTTCLFISTNDSSCSAMHCDSVVITKSCHASFSVYQDSVDVKKFIIINQSTGIDLTYYWNFGDGQTSNSPNPGAHTYASYGSHHITLLVTDSIHDCSSYFDVTTYSECSALFNFQGIGNKTVSFSPVTMASTNQNIFSWNFGDGNISQLRNPEHTYTANGSYNVCLTTRSIIDSSCKDTRCTTVNISDLCHAYFTIAQDPNHPNAYILNNQSTGSNLTYAWNFGDGTTCYLQNPGSHTYATNGIHVICLTISDTSGSCFSSYCDTIGAACLATFSYYPLYSYVYSFTAHQNSFATYNWSFGDGTAEASSTPYITHSFPNNQLYHVCLTVASTIDSACRDTFCTEVNVNVKQCQAFYSVSADTTTSDTTDLIIYDQSTGDNLSYFWSFGDGTFSTLKNPVHDYSGNGPYMLCLTVTNDSCTSSHCDTILFPLDHQLLPGKWHIKVINKNVTTDIVQNAAEKITLENYPNPFTGSTTIHYRIANSSPIELSIYNLLGSKIEVIESGNKSPGNYNLKWEAPNLKEGIYLLQLKTDEQLVTKKIILTR